MRLGDIVVEGAVVPRLAGVDRNAVITELVDALVRAGSAPARMRDSLIASVLERERRHSTGFGKGVAVPHVKHASVSRVSAAVGLSHGGIEFDSLDRQPVFSVFLLLSPEDKPEEHLQAMEAIFKNLSKETFRRLLRQASTAGEVVALLNDADTPPAP